MAIPASTTPPFRNRAEDIAAAAKKSQDDPLPFNPAAPKPMTGFEAYFQNQVEQSGTRHLGGGKFNTAGARYISGPYQNMTHGEAMAQAQKAYAALGDSDKAQWENQPNSVLSDREKARLVQSSPGQVNPNQPSAPASPTPAPTSTVPKPGFSAPSNPIFQGSLPAGTTPSDAAKAYASSTAPDPTSTPDPVADMASNYKAPITTSMGPGTTSLQTPAQRDASVGKFFASPSIPQGSKAPSAVPPVTGAPSVDGGGTMVGYGTNPTPAPAPTGVAPTQGLNNQLAAADSRPVASLDYTKDLPSASAAQAPDTSLADSYAAPLKSMAGADPKKFMA